MRTLAMLVLLPMALVTLSMGALMVSDGLVLRGLAIMAATWGPAHVLRQMYRRQASGQRVA